MRLVQVLAAAALTAAALMALAAGQPARAQATGTIVSLDAIPPASSSAARRTRKPAQSKADKPDSALAFIDEQTPWIAPPPAPPEVPQIDGVLQCVPYARFVSGIGLRGDAWTWWDQAAGIFARGNHPEPGAVLSFPAIERMPLGHIAVVHQVLSRRKILIDHANWPNAIVLHGAISHDILVEDMSPANDWTEVRVQFGEGGPMGSVYPVNGFIYGWSETGVRLAHPRFALDYALWSPGLPSWRTFNAMNYAWVLPPAERKKAYAAAEAISVPVVPAMARRPALTLGPIGHGPLGSLGPGILRFDLGNGTRPLYAIGQFIVR